MQDLVPPFGAACAVECECCCIWRGLGMGIGCVGKGSAERGEAGEERRIVGCLGRF